MATFPPAVSPQGSPNAPQGGAPQPGGASPSGNPAIQLAMLGQVIQGLARQYPQGAQAIQTMMQGLRQLQGIAQAQSTPAQPAAPPQ